MAKTDNLGPSLIVVAVIITSAVYGWSWWYILPLIAAYWYSQSIEETYKGARDLAKEEQRLKNEHLRLQNEKLEVDIEIAKLRKDATRERLHKGDYRVGSRGARKRPASAVVMNCTLLPRHRVQMVGIHHAARISSVRSADTLIMPTRMRHSTSHSVRKGMVNRAVSESCTMGALIPHWSSGLDATDSESPDFSRGECQEKKVRYIRRILESSRPLDSQEIAVLNNEVVPYLKTLRPLEGVP